jgi:diguanylate cyclase (GGDEF)-like protein
MTRMLPASHDTAGLGAFHRLVLRWGGVRVWLATSGVLGGAVLAAHALAVQWLQPAPALGPALWMTGLALLLAPLVAALLCRMAQAEAHRLAEAAKAAAPAARHGMAERSHFQEAAEREFARCRRYREDAAVLLVAADHFKAVAGEHGTAAAEALLTAVALRARGSLRQPDLLARYGTEELVVLLPHTDPLGALDVAERIREGAAHTRLKRGGAEFGTTVSVGVASLGVGHDALDVLTHDADLALLSAKQAGRNCVRAAPIVPRSSEDASFASPRH